LRRRAQGEGSDRRHSDRQANAFQNCVPHSSFLGGCRRRALSRNWWCIWGGWLNACSSHSCQRSVCQLLHAGTEQPAAATTIRPKHSRTVPVVPTAMARHVLALPVLARTGRSRLWMGSSAFRGGPDAPAG
jgi:hypothetical protein